MIEDRVTLDEIETMGADVVVNALETEDEVELEVNDDLEYERHLVIL